MFYFSGRKGYGKIMQVRKQYCRTWKGLCRSQHPIPEGFFLLFSMPQYCTEFLTSHTKPCLVCSKLIPRLLPLALNSHRWGQPFRNFCEHVYHVFAKFVVKLLIVSEVLHSIIKLTQGALKELVEIKFL